MPTSFVHVTHNHTVIQGKLGKSNVLAQQIFWDKIDNHAGETSTKNSENMKIQAPFNKQRLNKSRPTFQTKCQLQKPRFTNKHLAWCVFLFTHCSNPNCADLIHFSSSMPDAPLGLSWEMQIARSTFASVTFNAIIRQAGLSVQSNTCVGGARGKILCGTRRSVSPVLPFVDVFKCEMQC